MSRSIGSSGRCCRWDCSWRRSPLPRCSTRGGPASSGDVLTESLSRAPSIERGRCSIGRGARVTFADKLVASEDGRIVSALVRPESRPKQLAPIHPARTRLDRRGGWNRSAVLQRHSL